MSEAHLWRMVPLVTTGRISVGSKSIHPEMAILDAAGDIVALVRSVGATEAIIARHNAPEPKARSEPRLKSVDDDRGKHGAQPRSTYRLVNGLTAISTGARDVHNRYRPMLASNGVAFQLDGRRQAWTADRSRKMPTFNAVEVLPPVAAPAKGQSDRLKTVKRSPRGE